MNQRLVFLAQKIGIDKAIAYSSGSRIVGGLTGVLSVFFISTFLTGVEQGFYFTFGSLLALQVFFELGLTGIMIQFVAHEVSHLTLNDNAEYEGEERYKSRLASLIRFCVKWYTVLAVIIFLFLIIVGFVYFHRYGGEHSEVDWETPWVLICLGTALKLLQSPFNSIFMGLGKVKEMSEIGFWQQVILPTVTWAGLASGFKLYIIGIGYLASVVIWQAFVHFTGLAKIIVNLWKIKLSESVSYMKEILPFQWRIALSWVSGYFIFQLFNPVLFATDGAVVAGQMGMTLIVLNAIQALSFSWMNTKVPLYSQLIAQRNYTTLDIIFNKTLKQMVGVCTVLLLFFLALLRFLDVTQFSFGENVLANRFLGYLPVILLMFSIYLQQYINAWASYLRCHKKEPFLWLSLITGVLCMMSTLILGYNYGVYGVVIGYCCIQCFSMPWAYYIYKNKKRIWHNDA